MKFKDYKKALASLLKENPDNRSYILAREISVVKLAIKAWGLRLERATSAREKAISFSGLGNARRISKHLDMLVSERA